jgi:hypothetical protein
MHKTTILFLGVYGLANWIYCTILQLVTTLHESVPHTDQFSASGLTSISRQPHTLDAWLQLALPSAASSRAADFQLPISNFSCQFSTGYRAELTSFPLPNYPTKSKLCYDRRSVGQSGRRAERTA